MRNVPAMILAALSGMLVSMTAGFAIASWAFAGLSPANGAPPTIARPDTAAPAPDSWRAAGYEKVGVWAEDSGISIAEAQAAGSSRL